MNKIIHPTRVLTFNHISNLGGWGISMHMAEICWHKMHLMSPEKGEGRSADSFCRNWGKIGLNSGEKPNLCVACWPSKKRADTLQEIVERNNLMTFRIALQQSALVSALRTEFPASAKPSSTSQASARRTFVVASPRRSLGRRTHQKS